VKVLLLESFREKGLLLKFAFVGEEIENLIAKLEPEKGLRNEKCESREFDLKEFLKGPGFAEVSFFSEDPVPDECSLRVSLITKFEKKVVLTRTFELCFPEIEKNIEDILKKIGEETGIEFSEGAFSYI